MTLPQPAPADRAAALAPSIGYTFRDAELLDRALTHSSFANDEALMRAAATESATAQATAPPELPAEPHAVSFAEAGVAAATARAGEPVQAGTPRRDYESLEFLGDAVLGFLVAEEILRRFPDRTEGEMSRLRASLVSARALAERSDALGLAAHIRLGRGERAGGGDVKRSILADAFESILGAIYLDGGIRPARAFVKRQFGATIRRAKPAGPQAGDFKTRLQEIVQADGAGPPVYRLLSEEGPPHRRVFEVEVRLPGDESFQASGHSKKQAEQAAAESALRWLEEVRPP